MAFFSTLYFLIQFLITLGVCGFVTIVVYLFYIHNKYSHIPGPPRDSFFLGNLPTLSRWAKERNYILAQACQEWSRTYGSTFVIFILHQAMVVTMDQDAIKELYLTDGVHPKVRDWRIIGLLFGARFLGRGLVTEPDHHVWVKRRGFLNPVFQGLAYGKIMPAFNKIGDRLIAKLKTMADGKTPIELGKEIHFATLETIAMVIFGKNLDILHDKRGVKNPYLLAITRCFDGFTVQRMNPLLNFKFWDEREYKENARNACHTLRTTAQKWLSERREAIRRGETVPNDTLTAMVKAEEEAPAFMKLESELDDLVTLISAGQDTVAEMLSFTLYELARNKNVEDKLLAELNTVFGKRGTIEYDDLRKIEYTNNTLKESLRMYPPAAMMFKETGRDIMIEKYKVPNITDVAVSPYMNGRSEAFHKDPLVFRPERFNHDCSYRPTMYTFFPYGLGERNCIGRNLAKVEGAILLVKLMQHFKFEVPSSYKFGIKECLSMRPLNDLRAIVSLRK